MSRLSPNLEEDFLEEIIHVCVIVDDSADDRPKQRGMPPREEPEGAFVAVLNTRHEFFIRGVTGREVRAMFELVVFVRIEHGWFVFGLLDDGSLLRSPCQPPFTLKTRAHGPFACLDPRHKVSRGPTGQFADNHKLPDVSARPRRVNERIIGIMDPVPDLNWPRLAAFIRQHAHDVRNHLNGLDLEAALLADLIAEGDPEAGGSVTRLRAQLRRLATDLRTLSGKFADPHPSRAPIGARELWLIWQDQVASSPPGPAVEWTEQIGPERVDVDASVLAGVFRELLANAQAFGTGAPLRATVRAEGGRVIFELGEPKTAPLETENWGRVLFASTRRGGYGLGLWEVQRTVEANGGTVQRRYDPETRELTTRLSFPAV
jgi:hypothetical protein